MADNSTLKDSTIAEGSISKVGVEKRKKRETKYMEPAMNKAGYVNGSCYPYRGRNMDSFCREHKDRLFVPE